ncbi:MAG: CHAD domain-containing protein [Chloroflexi bacterium]|nr:CHAD domain-containing protein [Chloroflexota bacterium]
MSNKLSGQEKSLLEKIADSSEELLARRAMIILMTDGGSSAANIAREVNLTPKTVQRWQKKFVQKRLGIFPEGLFAANPLLTLVTETEAGAKVQTAPRPAKAKKAKKAKKLRQSEAKTEYPVRNTIGLEPTDSLAEAGRKVLSFHFGRMLSHEPGTRQGNDIEALHDMRVATRRMRAAFRVFGSGFRQKTVKPLLVGLRTTARILGQVRDLDVFMDKLQQYQQILPENEQAGLQLLLETWSAKREQARQEMLAYLDSKKYRRFKKEFLKFVTTPGLGVKPISDDKPVPYQLRYLVPGLIYDRYEAVHAYETKLEKATPETLHQLRITFKQFRYALEFFAEILGEEGERVIEAVKALQDHLGELNDAEVASHSLRDLLAEWDQNQAHLPLTERQSPTQLAAYLEAKLEERQRLLETFPQAWACFNQPELRRNLALAISVL